MPKLTITENVRLKARGHCFTMTPAGKLEWDGNPGVWGSPRKVLFSAGVKDVTKSGREHIDTWRVLETEDGRCADALREKPKGFAPEGSKKDKPEEGKTYRLTGTAEQPSVARGDDWAASEVSRKSS